MDCKASEEEEKEEEGEEEELLHNKDQTILDCL